MGINSSIINISTVYLLLLAVYGSQNSIVWKSAYKNPFLKEEERIKDLMGE